MPIHSREQARLVYLRPVPDNYYEKTEPWTCRNCNETCPYKHCPMCMRQCDSQDFFCARYVNKMHSFCIQHGLYMVLFMMLIFYIILYFFQVVKKNN